MVQSQLQIKENIDKYIILWLKLLERDLKFQDSLDVLSPILLINCS